MEKWQRKCAGIGDGDSGGGGGDDNDNADECDYDENDDDDDSHIGDGHNMQHGVCLSVLSLHRRAHTNSQYTRFVWAESRYT